MQVGMTWVRVLAAVAVFLPAAHSQQPYQFTTTNGVPFGLRFAMDPSGIIGDCFSPSGPGYCVTIFTAGGGQKVTFNMTAPASVSATKTNDVIQLGPATFNLTTSGASGLT